MHIVFSHTANVSRSPLTHQTGGPEDKPLKEIAARLNAEPEQVLLAWAKLKGVVVVTYAILCVLLAYIYHRFSASTRKERLEKYLAAGDLGRIQRTLEHKFADLVFGSTDD